MKSPFSNISLSRYFKAKKFGVVVKIYICIFYSVISDVLKASWVLNLRLLRISQKAQRRQQRETQVIREPLPHWTTVSCGICDMSIVNFIIQGTLLGAGVLILVLILLYWIRWTKEKCQRRKRDEINRDFSDDERENVEVDIEAGDTDSGMV